jgi:hypothetical protein
MDDALDVLAWRNDPHTIAMSKTPGVIDQASHIPWFAKAVRSEDRVIFIAVEADMKLGMVRFDRTDDAWLVSVNLAKDVVEPVLRHAAHRSTRLKRKSPATRDAGVCARLYKIEDPAVRKRVFELTKAVAKGGA